MAENIAYWFFTLIIIIITGAVFEDPPSLRSHDVLRALDKAHTADGSGDSSALRVAIGYNANLDLVVNAVDMLDALHLKPTPVSVDHEDIKSEEEFVEAFQHFFSNSAAGERHVANSDLYSRLSSVHITSPDIEHELRIGGNAALMGERFAASGAKVLLGGHCAAPLRALLSNQVTVAGDEPSNDEVHVIMEFSTGDEWGSLKATRGNRFIAVADEANAELRPLQAFHDAIAAFAPHVVVLSGLHLLEALPRDARTARLQDVQEAVLQIDAHVPIHLELASMADSSFVEEVATVMFPHVDSLGMNEQELAFIAESLGGSVDREKVAVRVPEPVAVADSIKYILDTVHAGTREISRVHFHSFGFHLLVARRVPNTYQWAAWAGAAAKGSVTATMHACQSDAVADLKSEDVSMAMSVKMQLKQEHVLELTDPVPSWTIQLNPKRPQEVLEFYLAPVVQCAAPKSTVGLGDNISAAALAHQLTSSL